LEETRHYFSYIQKNIDRLNRYVTDNLKAEFVVFLFPRHYQYSTRESPKDWERNELDFKGAYINEPFRYFEEQSPTMDYPVYSLREHFERTEVFPTTFYADPHWTVEGTRVAAEGILKTLRANGALEF